ncbi:DUF1090 family protein [Xenorhabdus sp. 18]|uniref:DUF1090 family protein n=1 Tax=Xenorhabdus doucetiae TaxID=351671 RepID=UPI00198B1FCE|nr:DUF1090 family protein [Xenorhabdus sp. 18]MBD2796191.1 DUF1090 family protein [Xenorhabdus sp. 18]
MMSKTVILSVLIVFSMNAADANQGKAGCEIKKKTLEKQLEYAQADKDVRLIKGLTRTLEYIKVVCALEKRLRDQNNKPEMVKNNVKDNITNKDNSSLLKQSGSKNQSYKPSKNNKIDTRKK